MNNLFCINCGNELKVRFSKTHLCKKCYSKSRKDNADPRKCIDCGSTVKRRRKETLRCYFCNREYKRKYPKGRTTGNCILCGKKLSTKINKTGKCGVCSHGDYIPWNKGMKGLVPWNKGKSIFKNEKERKLRLNQLRKEKRLNESQIEKMPDRIRTLIRNSIRKNTKGERRKNSKTEKILGCSILEFIIYLESQFKPGMSWSNYGNGKGKWNIDHIIPVSRFNLKNKEELLKAFNYKNCRPMWASDNFKKGNKLIYVL